MLAGTDDGRILRHRRDENRWDISFGLYEVRGAITALVASKADEKIVYAGTSQGNILRSQDGGENWEILERPAYEFRISAIAVAPDDPRLLYVGCYGEGGNTVWKSQNMGQNWEIVPGVGLPRTSVNSLVIAGKGSYQLIAATADGLFTSKDGGVVWEKEPLTAPLASIQKLALGAGSSAPVYAMTGGSIYSSLDGELKTWIHGKGLRAEIARTVVVDPDNPRVAYAGVLILGDWSVFSTRDGGQTWQQTISPTMETVPDTTALAIAKQNGQTILYAGTIGCGILRSDDGGDSWNTFGRTRCNQQVDVNMPSDVSFLATDARDGTVVYAAASQKFYQSVNGGLNWRQYEPYIKSPIMSMMADPLKPNTVYLITGSDGFWRSENQGEAWQKLGEGYFRDAELTAMAAVPTQEGHLIVGASNGGIWETFDGGIAWRFIRENLAISSISSIVTSKALDGKILVGSLSEGMAVFTPNRLGSLPGNIH